MSENNAEITQEGSRGKVMGILAIVLAGIATFIPFLGVYLTVVAAILAAFSYGKSALFGYIAIGIIFLSFIKLIKNAIKSSIFFNPGILIIHFALNFFLQISVTV